MSTARNSYMRWLPQSAIEMISRLEFLAHGTVDGFVSGKHRSSRKGASVEFAEHRQYFPGDDLRNLDWKLVARRQRLYIREYVDETNLRATVVLDCSGSMAYASPAAEGGLTKFDYARHLAALLTYLLVRQQDGVGFVAYDKAVRTFMPAKAQPAQVRQVLEEVDRLTCAGETDSAATLHEVAERIPRRGVVFVISDLFGDVEETLKALHHLRFRHHEVVVLHVMDDAELNFPFAELLQFQDHETGEILNVDAQALRHEYLSRVEEYLARLKRGCGEMHITHELVNTKVPYDRALTDILVRYHPTGGRR